MTPNAPLMIPAWVASAIAGSAFAIGVLMGWVLIGRAAVHAAIQAYRERLDRHASVLSDIGTLREDCIRNSHWALVGILNDLHEQQWPGPTATGRAIQAVASNSFRFPELGAPTWIISRPSDEEATTEGGI